MCILYSTEQQMEVVDDFINSLLLSKANRCVTFNHKTMCNFLNFESDCDVNKHVKCKCLSCLLI